MKMFLYLTLLAFLGFTNEAKALTCAELFENSSATVRSMVTNSRALEQFRREGFASLSLRHRMDARRLEELYTKISKMADRNTKNGIDLGRIPELAYMKNELLNELAKNGFLEKKGNGYYYQGRSVSTATIVRTDDGYFRVTGFHTHDKLQAESIGAIYSLTYALTGPGTIIKTRAREIIETPSETIALLNEQENQPEHGSPSGRRLLILMTLMAN